MKAVKAASARKKLAAAEKAMTRKVFFQTKPDYEVAEMNFKNAALDFKLAKEIEQAIASYERAAECAVQQKDLYNAADHLQKAGKLALDERTPESTERALKIYDKASEYCQGSHNIEGAVELNYRLGRALLTRAPDKSCNTWSKQQIYLTSPKTVF